MNPVIKFIGGELDGEDLASVLKQAKKQSIILDDSVYSEYFMPPVQIRWKSSLYILALDNKTQKECYILEESS